MERHNSNKDMPCLYPFMVVNPRANDGSKIPVPCGKCPECLIRRSAHWIFRMKQEAKLWPSVHFITLTYNTDTVPITSSGFMTLNVKDLQDFWKRVRKRSTNKIRYYACGEYGSTRKRPHYHAIVFNLADPRHVIDSWMLGKIDIDTVKEGAMAYVCKYMHKGKVVPAHKNDDRKPEFSCMSKGLGANYLSDDIIKYHQEDVTRNYVIQDGFKVSMPRYYRDRVFSDEDKLKQQEAIQEMVNDSIDEERNAWIEAYGDMSGYHDAKRESKRQAVINFRSRAKQSRKL